MQRRDFLLGGLTGVGAAGGVALANEAMREPPPDCATDPIAPTLQPGELGPSPPDGRRLSFAQQGEDLVVRDVLDKLGITAPTYLDIGAFHPTIGSNTYLLYLLGAKGVLVEPNPPMVQLLQGARPRDTVLAVGVGIDDQTEADYYLIRNRPQLNTFSKEQADRYVAEGGAIEGVIKRPLVAAGAIINEHFETAPDFLSIDVEGLDLQILQTLDLEARRPAVICAETLVYGTHGVVGDTVDFLREREYVVRGGSFVNTIFVDEKRLQAEPGSRAGL